MTSTKTTAKRAPKKPAPVELQAWPEGVAVYGTHTAATEEIAHECAALGMVPVIRTERGVVFYADEETWRKFIAARPL